MIEDPKHPDETEAPGHVGNAGPAAEAVSMEGLEEQYQRSRDQAPQGERGVTIADSLASSAAGKDREQRVRQRAHQLWEAEGKPEADHHWSRAAGALDRKDSAGEGVAGEKSGVRPQGDADFVRDKS